MLRCYKSGRAIKSLEDMCTYDIFIAVCTFTEADLGLVQHPRWSAL